MWASSNFAIASRQRRAAACIAQLAWLVLASCGDASQAEAAPNGSVSSRSRPNVILICWDTVRADHLGCYGYDARPTTPNLDRLAERSIVFDSASSAAGWTKPSVPSFLTGTYPSQHGVYEGSARLEMGEVTDTLPAASTTLAEVFHGAGYETAAFLRNAQLRRGNGFEQGFELYRDEAGDARSIRWQALDWVDEREGEQPFFLYLHFLDAHWPYPIPEEYAQRYTDEDLERFQGRESKAYRKAVNDGTQPWTAEDRATLEALYDGSLSYLDDELGRFLAGLEARGLADDTVVCLVSDHGEEFGEHGRLGHGHGLWESLLRVPWVLHVPTLEPRRIMDDVSLVDLFPTLLRAAGQRVLPPTAGVDRLGTDVPQRPIFAEHKAPDRYLQSFRSGPSKLVRAFAPPARALTTERSLRIGGRWEASFQLDPEGRWMLDELEESEGDSEDPIELKGPLEAVDGESLVVAGVRVARTPSTLLSPTDDAEDEELYAGRMVKLRLLGSDTELTAERIKIYSRFAPDKFEVRGPLGASALEEQTVRVGPFALHLIEASDIDSSAWAGPRPMQRSEILRCLLDPQAVVAAGFGIERTEWEVEGWREELRPGAPGTTPLETGLDDLARGLAETRSFEDADRKVLTPEALEELRAIGYVE